VSPVRYELVFYIPEDDIPRRHLCSKLRSLISIFSVFVLTYSFLFGKNIGGFSWDEKTNGEYELRH
jgi:hypothetical protein